MLYETLEERRMLSAVNWDGGGGDLLWSNPLNWSADQLPTAADDVTIDAAGDVTIVHDVGTNVVASLDSRDSLEISGGTLEVAGSFGIDSGRSLTAKGGNTEFSVTGGFRDGHNRWC